MKASETSTRNLDLRGLGVILVIALVHGLIYVFLMPPWQHYDEPNHFERVAMTASLGRSPGGEEHDPEISRAVVKSMVANDFYANSGYLPDLSPNVEVRIPGWEQFSEKSMYYWLASLPLRLMETASVEAQLTAARLVSMLIYIFTIVAAWGSAREVVPPVHTLRWMLPLTIALLPGFAELMTAVNNDVAAVAAYSLFFWGALRLLRGGFSLSDFILCSLGAVLAFYAKNTAYTAILLYPVVILFSLLRGKLRRIAWVILAASMVLLFLFTLRFDEAAKWYRATDQSNLRVFSEQDVLGIYTLRLDTKESATPNWLDPIFQPLPTEIARQLEGRPLTFGLWMWAEQPVQAQVPQVNTTSQAITQRVQLSQSPQYYAVHLTLTGDTTRIWITIDPKTVDEEHTQIYYDGLVLTDGFRPIDQHPYFALANGTRGDWGGEPFLNFIRNPSFEEPGASLALGIDSWLTPLMPDSTRPSLILTSLLDWPASGWLFRGSGMNILHTFWGKFGWGHVPLAWEDFYGLMGWVALIGAIGAVTGLIIRIRRISIVIPLFVAGAFLLVLFSTLTRGAVYLAWGRLFIPGARYFYPAILPTMIILCLGWLEISRLVALTAQELSARWRGKPMHLEKESVKVVSFGFVLLLLALAGTAIYSVVAYYANM